MKKQPKRPTLTKAEAQLAYQGLWWWVNGLYSGAPIDDIVKLQRKLVKMGAKP